MARHLLGKVSRLIGDFNTIVQLTSLIEHELEKRIVARQGLVKLDALLSLLPRLKNEIRQERHSGSHAAVQRLTDQISRLRIDYSGGDLETGRDAMVAHALKLDLLRIVQTWSFMGATTFSVLRDDLAEIDAELKRISPNYLPASLGNVEPSWPLSWSDERLLGPPEAFRLVTVYPGLATAGIVAPVAGGHPAQDNWIRAVGLATFIRQTRLLWEAVDPLSTVGRLLAELAVNDILALWELLFTGGVQNEHGVVDKSVLSHWTSDGWRGASCLSQLEASPAESMPQLRGLRNRFTAHADPDADIWEGDVERWPLSPVKLFNEALRIIEALRHCASLDVRSKFLMTPPTSLSPDVVGLSGQEGKRWADA